ncbi:MAG: cobalamin-binding protein [Acidobacteria bacterium]|nr:cobalamin-binding protein [Acidobacteriota bacterium]
MQICSFLPSATEILYALGLGDAVAGVTFECDYPPEARKKPVVVNTVLRHDLAPEEIDREASKYASQGESLYVVDIEALSRIRPDLVLTQELCDVCAVTTPQLAKALAELSPPPKVLPLTPHTLEDVLVDIEKVGEAAGRPQKAAKLVAGLRERIARVEARPKVIQQVACLEWLNPLYNAGHWVPDMVKIAGACDPLAAPGEYSARITPEEILRGNPDVIVIMPCGYDAQRAKEEYYRTAFPAGWEDLRAVRNRRVYAVDASAYFSRPGPRLIDGIEILYALFHQDFSGSLPPASWAQV